jgi:transcriptional regulator with XRE-family HTH domain
VSHLSQKALSERSTIAASSLSLIENGKRVPTLDTVETLLRFTGHTLVAAPTLREAAAVIAGRIEAAIDTGRPDLALRHFIQLNDNLVAEHNEVRYALGLTEPASTGLKHWDAAIAALIAHRLAEEGFPAPSWTLRPDRFLRKKWTVSGGRYLVPVEIAAVPPEFLKRGVLVAPATLESV